MFGRFPVSFSGLHLPNFEAEQVRTTPNQPAFIIITAQICLLLANVSHVSDLAREPLVFNFVFLKYLRCTCT